MDSEAVKTHEEDKELNTGETERIKELFSNEENNRIPQTYTIDARNSVPLPSEQIPQTMTISVQASQIPGGRNSEIRHRVRSNTSLNALQGIAL